LGLSVGMKKTNLTNWFTAANLKGRTVRANPGKVAPGFRSDINGCGGSSCDATGEGKSGKGRRGR
jgi:hypothetical protein